MGMFKDLRKMRQQLQGMQANTDPAAMMNDAMQRMQSANQFLAQQTQAASLATTGLDATATITAVSQAGAMVNFQPTLQLSLTVLPDGRPPYPVHVTQVVQQIYLAKAVAGATVHVKVDPNDPSSVWINWAAA
jgi:uncharacterized membrane protein